MTRYLVRRATGEVFIWTEAIAARKDLEEVYADNAALAVNKDAMPTAAKVSVEQLEAMVKADLLIFAYQKLVPPLPLPVTMTKEEMVLKIKARLFGIDDVGPDIP